MGPGSIILTPGTQLLLPGIQMVLVLAGWQVRVARRATNPGIASTSVNIRWLPAERA